jgi:excinuclease ABC subunit C
MKLVMLSQLIEEQLRRLPSNPGVYLMKDASGGIIYVGKALNLTNRVHSYFGSANGLTPKTEQMVSLVHDIDYFVTNSEQEAMILELNLIKQYRPHFNVRLKDDKSFPYLKIDVNSDWPRICITRQWEQDGARYFGPFASTWSVRQTMKMIKNIFPTRSCGKPITGKDRCPCLDYHIKNCLGPCIGAVTKEEYAAVIKQITLFLEGKQEDVIEGLKSKMNEAAEALNFEKAAIYRNQIQAVQKVIEAQKIAMKVQGDQDAIAFVTDHDQAFVQVFFIRNSKLIGRESFILQGVNAESAEQIMTNFVKQFYDSSPYVPPLILLQYELVEADIIRRWLSSRRGSQVNIEVPVRGGKKQLVDIVTENARQGLEQHKIRQMSLPGHTKAALAELQKILNLPVIPKRIEGYDISNIQGTAATGSMVVFEDGRAKSACHRRFRIKTVPQANDYAMLREVIMRRFKYINNGEKSGDWAVLPDLVLIDGGKGQLNIVSKAMKEAGAADVPLTGLAKENEEIFLPNRSSPLVLPRNSPGLQLLQRVRDEAHRFAVGYHQKVHSKASFVSALDSITGIGPKRKRTLLKKFGSVQGIQKASIAEIASLGISQGLAERIKHSL